ncbi:MAG: NUDIX domain-containing protein [Clostridia bacterium]|nr:NUDIX domain-containing protein [Deltaproteobacteria bacterium]
MVHVKARMERPDIYPLRAAVSDEQVPWSTAFADYKPPYFVADSVLEQDETKTKGGWADPEDVRLVTRNFESFSGRIALDAAGRPMNVRGRTGIAGRGLLGRWGPNFAADALVFKCDVKGGVQCLLIKRGDSGQWAFPGGMVDRDETADDAMTRELMEETGVQLDLSRAVTVYRGYCDDRRNTDNAWMETTAKALLLDDAKADLVRPKVTEEAVEIAWKTLVEMTETGMYGSHLAILEKACALL